MALLSQPSLFDLTQGFLQDEKIYRIEGIDIFRSENGSLLGVNGLGRSYVIRYDANKAITSISEQVFKSPETLINDWEGHSIFHLLVKLDEAIKIRPSTYFDIFRLTPLREELLKMVSPRSPVRMNVSFLTTFSIQRLPRESFILQELPCGEIYWWKTEHDLYFLKAYLEVNKKKTVAMKSFINELYQKWFSKDWNYQTIRFPF